VLQKRNQRRRNGNDLPRRNVHERHFFTGHDGELTLDPGLDLGVDELPVIAEKGVGLGDDVPASVEASMYWISSVTNRP
jgi:hypothetical protein